MLDVTPQKFAVSAMADDAREDRTILRGEVLSALIISSGVGVDIDVGLGLETAGWGGGEICSGFSPVGVEESSVDESTFVAGGVGEFVLVFVFVLDPDACTFTSSLFPFPSSVLVVAKSDVLVEVNVLGPVNNDCTT
eukprot:CAMPEP_0203743550 /NCGR_PEP_ID=MMETSP0092-20131115/59502_1 /ASSEMBLY_ACC=CAM_ASM_001090 /TAXON_ID=426623 /ORGANISM="Chaetoceros affinis, Strain CCMP159" /LENGTH=136 /DNA_ID=CAMNT_0050630851 /DNA_START=716 /DNA_END=1123 /DNA_ORIENTATION=-